MKKAPIKISFPQIRRVVIEHFSLYKLVNKVQVDLKDGIFCLAGANGLGKSTFISILHYGLTGVVINPVKNFGSINQISKFYKDNRSFADEYFSGRIEEKDRGRACVTITFKLGDFEYSIKRNFFEPDELQEFSKKDAAGESVIETLSKPPKELNGLYQSQIKNELKFESFEQFAFLLYFLFTFDESRKLLFWDTKILSRILHLVFGTDATKAERSDFLKKEIAKHESNMRNIQNAIQKDEKTLASIITKLNQAQVPVNENIEEVLARHQELSSELSNILQAIEKGDKELKECSLKLADYSIRLTTLKKSYDELFESQFKSQPIEKDKRIIDVLKELEQIIITGKGDGQAQFEQLKVLIRENRKSITDLNKPEAIENLRSLDEKMFNIKNELSEATTKKSRLENEKEQLNHAVLKTQQAIQQIELEYKDVLDKHSKPPVGNQSLDAVIQSYQDVIAGKREEKAIDEQKRNDYQKELVVIEKELGLKYAQVEDVFIPIFTNYAISFLGLPVSINPQRNAEGFSLTLSVNNNGRTENYQLSESQRYFIDIALRMALVEYWCKGGTMMIDTPEGSLDIAYESKAGKMFADFALKNYDVIMTANINSSQLLIQMAGSCTQRKMKLERMTDWTTLSQVQEDEKVKINDAFTEIENKLIAQ